MAITVVGSVAFDSIETPAGRRERWLVGGQAAAAIAAGLFVWGFARMHPAMPGWIA